MPLKPKDLKSLQKSPHLKIPYSLSYMLLKIFYFFTGIHVLRYPYDPKEKVLTMERKFT